MIKRNKLSDYMDKILKNNIIVAFSGGVDSSLLLKVACDCAKKDNKAVYAVTINSIFNSVKDIGFTEEIAKKFGAIHKVIQINEFSEANIMNNQRDRCYHCKKYMFSKILNFSKEVGVDVILEGTNADDSLMYRPGLTAIEELGIISPLRALGFTKEEVRQLSAEYGICTSDKPSTPCYATRFEYGTKLSCEGIRKVELAEEYIKSLGFYNVRLRVHRDIARIEVDRKDIPTLIKAGDKVTEFIKGLGFKYVTVDMEGFVSGSMDR